MPCETLVVDEKTQDHQIIRTTKLKKERDNEKVEDCLRKIRKTAEGNENLMYPIIEALKAYATLGEIIDEMKELFGEYRETPLF